MESILELDPQEVKHIKKLFKSEEGLKATFVEHAADLFQTAFLMLLSSGAKTDNFTLLKQIEASEDEAMAQQFNVLLEIVLNLAAQVLKMNLKAREEFAIVLQELGLDGAAAKPTLAVYEQHYLTRITQINTAYEKEEGAQVEPKVLKKFPLNFGASDEGLAVSQPKLVDVDWRVDYALSSKNLNKLF